MIRINNLKYNKYKTEILWKSFEASSHGEKRTGMAPFIMFHVNNILIGLELTFSKEMFENTMLGMKTDMNRYISDIAYEDKKGWLSIRNGQYDCTLTRITEKNFHIDFHILAHDVDDEYDIFIDAEIELL